ncbi:hypothetical protein ANO14919_040620 [Xylariales sp. No.14919]|nr:hypothetical protein ANO14919_040620 [Xylariales sp. No.14919]
MCSLNDTVWYFAYGSNMSSAKFTGSRGIVPLDTTRVRIPNWVLTMEIPGMPYSEPSFSSIAPRDPASLEGRADPDVVGIAYFITQDQYRHVIASEGGGTAYQDLALVGELVGRDNIDKRKTGIRVRTLGSAMTRYPPPSPSRRYMDLLKEGSHEAQLPLEYQKYLGGIRVFDPPSSRWRRLGASMFVSLWGPVMIGLEKLTNTNIQADGNAQMWVILVVRFTMRLIWAVHDYLFAPIFGRGDGL